MRRIVARFERIVLHGYLKQNSLLDEQAVLFWKLFLLAGAGYFLLVFFRLFFFGGFYGFFLFLFAGILRFGHY